MFSKNHLLAGLMAGLTVFSLQLGPIGIGSELGQGIAEAGIFDDIGGAIKDAAKGMVKKELAIDMDGVHSHSKNLENHLYMASSRTAAADYQVRLACGVDDTATTRLGMFAGDWEQKRNKEGFAEYKEMPNLKKEEIKQYAASLESSDDQQKKAKAEEHIRWSKGHRAYSNVWRIMALRDAAFVVKETAKGIAHADNFDGIMDEINNFNTIANAAQGQCKFLEERKKSLDAGLKEYEKKHNIKEPPKKEIEKKAAEMELE